MISLELVKGSNGEHCFIGKGKKEDFKCSLCGIEINEGFICENDGELVLCQKCQDNYNMHRNCSFDKRGEHRHLKFTREIIK